MSIPAFNPLGATTTNRIWALDVEDPDDPGVFVGVRGITEIKPRPADATTQDDSDIDGEGYGSDVVTGLRWGVDGKVKRAKTLGDATKYDRGQEIMRKAAENVQSGGILRFRYYEMDPGGPREEAKTGLGVVTWTPDGGNQESLNTVAFSIKGRGKPESEVHPEAITPVPIISSILPAGAGDGAPIVIHGHNFPVGSTTASLVKFSGVNAASVLVTAEDTILVTMPNGDAGVVQVKVGTSAERNYTRGA